MEFRHLIISTYVLFSFVHARDYAHAWLPDEDYWQAVWPNTPIPSALQDLLKPAGFTGAEINVDLPMEIDDTQYPKTVFLQRDLYPGKTMNIQFTNIPFSQPINPLFLYVNEIKEEYTFEDMCVNRAVEGEDRYCAKSLGALIDFVTSKLGKNTKVLSGSFVKKQEQYTVEGVQNLGTKAVMCHKLSFQKTVFFCHEITATTAFMVSLAAADGTKTKALAVCHTHILGVDDALIHRAIKFNPGNNPFCHFSEDKAILWVPNAYSSDNVAI